MKDIIFVVILIILILIGIKVFLWAFKSVLGLAIVAGVIYLVVRSGILKKLFGKKEKQ